MTTGFAPRPTWTGEISLDLRNGQNRSAGVAELTLHIETINVGRLERSRAIVDRPRLAYWLTRTNPEPFRVDDICWSVEVGLTLLTIGRSTFKVSPESLSTLVSVI